MRDLLMSISILLLLIPSDVLAQSKVCVHRLSFVEDGFITVFDASKTSARGDKPTENGAASGLEVEYSDSSVSQDSTLIEYGDTARQSRTLEVVRGDTAAESSSLEVLRGDEGPATETEVDLDSAPESSEASAEESENTVERVEEARQQPSFIESLLGAEGTSSPRVSFEPTLDGFALTVDGLVLRVTSTPPPSSLADAWNAVAKHEGQGRMRLDTNEKPCVEGRASKRFDRIELKGESGAWLRFGMKDPRTVEEPQPRDEVTLTTFTSPLTLTIR